MNTRILTALLAAAALAGCGGWNPWSTSSASGQESPRTPPGAKAYACDGGKRLLVRFEGDGKSAWVIYPDRQFRLDRVVSASGEQFSNGSTLLGVKGEEALLAESGVTQFANCKLEPAK